MTKLFPGRENTCLLVPDREPMTDHNTDTTKVQLDEPIIFIGVSYRNIDKGLLMGAGRIQRAPLPKPKVGVTVHKLWNTLHSQQAARLVGECLSQVPQLMSASCRQLNWFLLLQGAGVLSKSLQLSFIWWERGSQRLWFTLARRGLVNLASFREFLKLISGCSPPCFRSSSEAWNILILE